ncbi:MAG: amidohydrolase family protein [Gemmatimonadaceae bacterium]|nr:amidohydrolase family protein [Gemmatimonadaceae bacterium]
MVRTRPLIACVLALGALACQSGDAPSVERVDILIANGTVITMDSGRRVIEDGAVAIRGTRIVEVGSTADLRAKYRANETIDATRKIVMPGLVDGHGHAGHGLVKTMGTDNGGWYPATEKIYANGSTVDFWRADALLTAVEKLKFGVTTSLTLFGGGDNVHRTDQVRYGEAYMSALDTVGLRWILAVGPRRPPFPKTFTQWDGGVATETSVSFEQQMAVSDSLLTKWNANPDSRVKAAVVFPTVTVSPAPPRGAELEELKREAAAALALARKHGALFAQDGHTRGTVKFQHEVLGISGPDVIFSHATELTNEEIQILARTNTRIAHNPSAVFSIRGRNPTTELIDAGVTVMLGSDGVAPDRSYDMFRHMFQAMRYHRFHFRDASVLPAGKVLEMVTVDAARALGMEDEIGSLEPGKRADVILIDWFKPHMVPMNMPLYRVAYFANGNDVATVLVDGRVLMRDRVVLSVNEERVLTFADQEAAAAITRTGLEELLETPEGFWGRTRLPSP